MNYSQFSRRYPKLHDDRASTQRTFKIINTRLMQISSGGYTFERNKQTLQIARGFHLLARLQVFELQNEVIIRSCNKVFNFLPISEGVILHNQLVIQQKPFSCT